MKFLIFCIAAVLVTACSHDKGSEDKNSPTDKKVYIDTSDVKIENKEIQVPIQVRCIKGYKTVVLQIGDVYKAFSCDTGAISHMHRFSIDTMKENRAKKKDYILRIRAFHEERKDVTLSQVLVILSYKDYQPKLFVNQALVTMAGIEGTFSDLSAHGQCVDGSTVEIEVFDDWRGVSLEEESVKCSETGFSYVSRRPGAVKKGMRLLIRQLKGEKAVASYEVVLFN